MSLEDQVNRLAIELKASREAHGELLAANARQAEEFHKSGEAFQAALSQVAGAEQEAQAERARRVYQSEEIGEFVARVTLADASKPGGERIVLITEKDLNAAIDGAAESATAKLTRAITSSEARAIIAASSHPRAAELLEVIEELRPDAAFYKW